MPQKAVVTGGAGFIGSHLVDALIARQVEVIAVDDLSSGSRDNLHPRATLVELDIRERDLVNALFERERPSLVFHHAAQVNLRRSVREPALDASINIIGTVNLLEACAKTGVSKFLLASSGGAVYGDQAPTPSPESVTPTPASPYGVAKFACERYLHCFAQLHGFQWVALRYANVYGPRQSPHGEAGVVAIFASRLLAGDRPVINQPGTQTRDYVYVADCVAANLAAFESDRSGIYNVGTGQETDVLTIYRKLEALSGLSVSALPGPAQPGEQMRSCLDCGLARSELGWRSQVTLDDGLKRTLEWFRSQRTV